MGGLSAVVAGVLVAVKQLFPNQDFGYRKLALPGNYLPFVAISGVFVAYATRQASLGTVLFLLSGVQVSWTYLRFFQKQDYGRGDQSDAFAFKTLFPHPLGAVAGVFGAIAFYVFRPVLLYGANVTGAVPEKTVLPVSVVDAADAERRRQRAIRSLDARLEETTTSDQTAA